MNNLMQNIKTMSSREIATLTKKDHSHVIRDIRSMLSQIDDPNMDDTDFKEVFDGRGYTSEINLNKDLTLTLVAGYNSRFRYLVIKRWQELEANASQPVVSLPHDYISALEELLTTKKGEQAALEQVKELQPLAAALDTLSHAKGSLGIRETAKAVGIPEREFVRRCLDKSKPVSSRFLYRDDHGRLNAHAHRIKQGFMTQKIGSYADRDGHDFATVQVKFTAAGVAHIAKLMQNKPPSQLRVV